MAIFGVDTGELRTLAQTLSDASRAARELAHHPGVVRGRAQDGGDESLRDAAEHFADRWHWGLSVLHGDVRRLADVLRTMADAYDACEVGARAEFRMLLPRAHEPGVTLPRERR